MSGPDSLFSCIQPAGEPRGDVGVPMPAPPPPAPPAVQAGNDELAARLVRNEERQVVTERRLAELENNLSAVKTELARTRESLAAVPAPAAIAELKQELSVLSRRLSVAEAAASDTGREGQGGAVEAAERRLKETEARIGEEIERRFAGLDTAIFEVARKALTAKEAAAGNTRRLERLEERTARLTYIEKRLNSSENKFERICECEALAESLKVSVEEVERTLAEMLQKEVSLSAENSKTASDLQSLSAQVGQIGALFNHFRSELSFLVPGRKDVAGG